MTTRAMKLRLHHARSVANERISRSKYVIWCFEPEKMPAMIDLLIAQGRLSESDRPHCVHWTTIEGAGTDADIVKVIDADEMLDQAGIRTLTGDGWEALMQGAEALDAFLRDRCADRHPDEIDEIRKFGEQTRRKLSAPA